MASDTFEKLSASGHLVQDTVNAPKMSATTDDALVLGNVVYKKATGNFGKNTGATEAVGTGVCGIADGTYAGAAQASAFVDGALVAGLAGLTAGQEYWSKEDGTLDLFANVGSGKWTRLIGVAESATSLRVQMGELTQHP